MFANDVFPLLVYNQSWGLFFITAYTTIIFPTHWARLYVLNILYVFVKVL